MKISKSACEIFIRRMTVKDLDNFLMTNTVNMVKKKKWDITILPDQMAYRLLIYLNMNYIKS